MSEHNRQQEIQQNVLARIRGGAAHMHSRSYFVGRVAVTITAAILSLSLSTFVLSFILFSIHESGEQFLLGFGTRGAATFIGLFPWVPLMVDITLWFLLEWLLQGFKIGYRFSLLSIFLVLLVSSTVLAVVVNLTPLHGMLLNRADRGQLPIIGGMYESIRDSHQAQGIFRGTVTLIDGNTIVITHDDTDHDRDDGTQTVVVPDGQASTISVGSREYVFGSFDGRVVQAYGVQTLSPGQ